MFSLALSVVTVCHPCQSHSHTHTALRCVVCAAEQGWSGGGVRAGGGFQQLLQRPFKA